VGLPDQRQEVSGFPGDELGGVIRLQRWFLPRQVEATPSPGRKRRRAQADAFRYHDAVPDIPRQPPRPPAAGSPIGLGLCLVGAQEEWAFSRSSLSAR